MSFSAIFPANQSVSWVSPNVKRTLIPTVRTPLEHAVLAFGSVKKATPTQENPHQYQLMPNRFKLLVNKPNGAQHISFNTETA